MINQLKPSQITKQFNSQEEFIDTYLSKHHPDTINNSADLITSKGYFTEHLSMDKGKVRIRPMFIK